MLSISLLVFFLLWYKRRGRWRGLWCSLGGWGREWKPVRAALQHHPETMAAGKRHGGLGIKRPGQWVIWVKRGVCRLGHVVYSHGVSAPWFPYSQTGGNESYSTVSGSHEEQERYVGHGYKKTLSITECCLCKWQFKLFPRFERNFMSLFLNVLLFGIAPWKWILPAQSLPPDGEVSPFQPCLCNFRKIFGICTQL